MVFNEIEILITVWNKSELCLLDILPCLLISDKIYAGQEVPELLCSFLSYCLYAALVRL